MWRSDLREIALRPSDAIAEAQSTCVELAEAAAAVLRADGKVIYDVEYISRAF
jgi:hypothetical protein